MSAQTERPEIDVNLHTVERVEAILAEDGEPLSRNQIHQRLTDSGGGTTPARLNRVLEYEFKRGHAVEGSKGIQWTLSQSPSLRRARATGRRL